MKGRLIAVVGPSGVGKDSVMTAMAARRPDLGIVRRVITRAPGLGGEDYEAVGETEFAHMAATGAFCLHWRAHGLHYGIPASVRDRLADGRDMLVNLSRGVLAEMQAAFPGAVVLHLTARPETLAERLAGRGREPRDVIEKRLARADLSLPAGVRAVEIPNDGPLSETVDAALAALYPARV